jgi:hypothetical protein
VTDAKAAVSEFGEPLPVVVRVYALRSEAAFQRADYDELWRDPVAVLGDDLQGQALLRKLPAGQRQQVDVADLQALAPHWLGFQVLLAADTGGAGLAAARRRRLAIPADQLGAIVLVIHADGLELRANPTN